MPETFRVNAQKRVAVQYGQKRDKSKQMPLPSMQALDAHSHSQVFRSRPAPIQRILGCLMAQCVLACTNRAGASIAASNNIKFILIQGITGSYCHILSSLPTVMEHLPSSSSKASWHHALLLEQRVDTHTHTYNLHPAIHWHHYKCHPTDGFVICLLYKSCHASLTANLSMEERWGKRNVYKRTVLFRACSVESFYLVCNLRNWFPTCATDLRQSSTVFVCTIMYIVYFHLWTLFNTQLPCQVGWPRSAHVMLKFIWAAKCEVST